MARTKNPTDAILDELRAFGLAYPGAHTKSPWPGHLDLAVKDKTFTYLSVEGEPFGISCKLPHSGAVALMLPFTKPTEYGLGKSGWVSARFAAGEAVPVDMLKAWIDESYRAQAPRKLVAGLDAATVAPTPASKATPKSKAVTPRIEVAPKGKAAPKNKTPVAKGKVVIAKAEVAPNGKAAPKSKTPVAKGKVVIAKPEVAPKGKAALRSKTPVAKGKVAIAKPGAAAKGKAVP